jgi:ribosomal protein S18 acetylase RimI-like enzyme
MSDLVIRQPETPDEVAACKALFEEYADWLDIDLCFQDFDEEMASFPAKYAAPEGRLLLALLDGAPVGAVGLCRLDDGACEMKRLYVREAARGHAAGGRLAREIVEAGRALGYRTMRLDTLDRLTSAIRIYRALGFREIPPYYHNPEPGVIYMELDLAQLPAT